MIELLLTRDTVTAAYIYGTLELGELTVHTLERPWLPTAPGGKPFESCIPAGRYQLLQHHRPSGDLALALSNPGHAVYYQPHHRPQAIGRYLILIHPGNTLEDIVGCIAPGFTRAGVGATPLVTQSRAAMRAIMQHLGGQYAELVIRWRHHEP